MVKKTLRDYYNEIIQRIPELQKIPREEAEKVILASARHGFVAMRRIFAKDSFAVINLKQSISSIYVNNKYAYRYKKKKLWLENYNRLLECCDLDETRLYPEEHPVVEEWEGDRKDMGGTKEGTGDTGE